MHKFKVLIAFTILASTSFAQEFKEVNPDKKNEEVDDALKCRDIRFRMVPDCNGLVYIDEDQGGAVIHQKSGKPFSGSCKVCHINGNVEMFLNFQGGFPVGADTTYYENGNIQLIRNHDPEGGGKEHGTWKMYRADGSLKWEKNYVYGAEDGESRYYHPDSSIQKIETWNMGQLDGRKQEYYPNGTLKKEIMYSGGEWNGKYITYFDNGMVESEQEYKMGKKQGLSRYYYDNGTLLMEEFHENGCREGEHTRFYPTENMKWTVENYKDNNRHGLFEEYYNNDHNTIKYRAVYRKGMLIEQHFFDEFGEETSPPEDKGTFTLKAEKDEIDLSGWPENPTDEFLEEHQFTSRKQYNKARKNYIWYHKKKKKEQEKNEPKPKC